MGGPRAVKDWALRVGTALLAVVAVLPADAAGAADPAPLITDAAGDANGLGMYHVPGGQVRALFGDQLDDDPFMGGVSTAPASVAGSDLLSAGYDTPYQAIPVGGDGIDYRATGLRIHLKTSAQPGSASAATTYTVYAHLVDEFGTVCRTAFAVSLPQGAGPGTYPVSWRFETQFDSLCPRPGGNYTDPGWTATVTSTGLTMHIASSGLVEEERYVIAEGVPIARSLGITMLSAAQMDRTPFGAIWLIGQDMPPDVPCTTGCP